MRKVVAGFTRSMMGAVVAALVLGAPAARADVVTRWNEVACDLVAASGLGPPPAYRVMALVQSAVEEAVSDAEALPAARRAAMLEPAVAGANRAMLLRLLPAQREAIEDAYRSALAGVQGAVRNEGMAIGEHAANAVLARRGDDGAGRVAAYRPQTQPGAYVPTTLPAAPHWGGRKPWAMRSGDEFRPGPPASLDSAQWARDFEEIRALGAKNSTVRTPAQTEIARFWEYTGPSIYFSLVRSVAEGEGRDPARNARLLAAAGRAMDEALIAVFDAKYSYQFWRPITAIRNGDLDGNDATERDAHWVPLIETPMHPEYPCAHCSLAGAVGTVLQRETGRDEIPGLCITSPAMPGVKMKYGSVEDFIQQVATARILDGVHYRTSTEAGIELGRKVGTLFVP